MACVRHSCPVDVSLSARVFLVMAWAYCHHSGARNETNIISEGLRFMVKGYML